MYIKSQNLVQIIFFNLIFTCMCLILTSKQIFAENILLKIDNIVSSNNKVLSAYQDVIKSQKNLDNALNEFYPKIYSNYQLSKTDDYTSQLSTPNYYQSNLQLQADLYLFKNGLYLFENLTLKQIELELAKNNFQKIYQDIKAEFLLSYFNYYIAYQNYQLRYEQVQFYENILKLTQNAYNIGDKSEVEYSNAKLELDIQKDFLLQENLNLNNLFLKLKKNIPEDIIFNSTPNIEIDKYLSFIPKQNILNNLELKILINRIDIQNFQTKITDSQNRPSVKLFFTKSYYNLDGSFLNLKENLFKEKDNTFGINIYTPIIDFKNGTDVEIQSEEQTKLIIEKQELIKDLELQLPEYSVLLEQNIKRYANLKEQLLKAQNNLEKIKPLYQKGIISYFNLQDYCAMEQRIRQNLLDTEKTIFTSIIELKKINGSL